MGRVELRSLIALAIGHWPAFALPTCGGPDREWRKRSGTVNYACGRGPSSPPAFSCAPRQCPTVCGDKKSAAKRRMVRTPIWVHHIECRALQDPQYAHKSWACGLGANNFRMKGQQNRTHFL